ncbi:MAG: HD domain-containing protein [Candidatus Delongbacteria bacterium]|jgi:HD-GYP domain-containing protein (c-di-GMP phosphodiesterase class II)|nr:HD domain-containing protein [Candidatus Delongbacteria bacterium]
MNYKEMVFSLNRIGIALGSETKLNNLFNLIVDEIIDFTNCDGCSLYITDLKKQELIFEATKTISLIRKDETSVFKSFSVPLDITSISGYTAITGETVNITDCYNIDNDKEYGFDKSYDVKTGYKTVSMLSVPMKSTDGITLGVIQLINNFDNDSNIVPFYSEFEQIILSLASQAAVALSNVRLLEANKNLYKALVKSFSQAIEERSPHTAGHSKRVAYISEMIANHINKKKEGVFANITFSEEKLEELKYAALLHDVGKVAVPENVLEKQNKLSDDEIEVITNRFETIKFSATHNMDNLEVIKETIDNIDDELSFIISKNLPGFISDEDKIKVREIGLKIFNDFDNSEHNHLTEKEVFMLTDFVKGNFSPDEWEKMKKHVSSTLDILKEVPFTDELKDIPKIAGAHHEMLDGSGYPLHLGEEKIMLQSRILAVADVFEALTAADRPYKKAVPLDRSLKIIGFMAKDGELDKELVNMFLDEKLYEIYLEDRDNDRIFV